MTKGENVQLTEIVTQLAVLTSTMSNHNELHKKLDRWMDKMDKEVYGEGSDPGIRGDIEKIQSRQNHIWYLYGLIFIAVIGAVVEAIAGG